VLNQPEANSPATVIYVHSDANDHAGTRSIIGRLVVPGGHSEYESHQPIATICHQQTGRIKVRIKCEFQQQPLLADGIG
jgi:hypothetical protein